MEMQKIAQAPLPQAFIDLHPSRSRRARRQWIEDRARIEREHRPQPQRVAMRLPDLMAHVERALAIADVAPTTFGHIVSGQNDLLTSIRNGRNPGRDMRLRIEGAANRLIDDARDRAFATLLAGFGRKQIEDVIEEMVSRLDRADGDLDMEDSETGSTSVDDRGRYLHERRIGEIGSMQCEDAEPDDDAKGDVSWTEWQSRGRHKLTGFGSEGPTHSLDGMQLHEDDEDSDPVEANGDEHDTGDAEDDALSASGRHWGTYWNGRAPGCPISDPGAFGAANQGTEDDEDDDPLEANGDERDSGNGEDEVPAESAASLWHRMRSGPGCTLSDPGGTEIDERDGYGR